MKKRRIRQCVLRTGRKPISCRWRDINKGDSERVEVRSRSIAREIKQKGTDIYFAGTPPLALVRYVMCRATLSKAGKRRQLMVLDAKRAFLHADALTETCVKRSHLRDTERCWLLKKCKDGTLTAAGKQHFRSESWDRHWLACSAQAVVHVRSDTQHEIWTWLCMVDDFIVAGDGDDFDRLSRKLNEKLELVQKARLGPGYDSETTVLNHCVT